MLVVLSLSLFANRTLAASEPIAIEGLFVDKHTGRGIGAARVELSQRHWGMLMEPAETFLAATQTNGQGHFLFVGPWSGPFRLRCYSEDFRKMGTKQVRGAARDLRIEARSMNATR
jgi:hypothetical protein